MKRTTLRKLFSLLLMILLVGMLSSGCADSSGEAQVIQLSDGEILLDGAAVGEDAGDSVYISHDIIYYEDKDAYESGNPYGEGTDADKHTAAEAAAHTVVNITDPGTYRISGQLSLGQIRVDLGEDAFTDPEAVVTLILDGVDLTCEVAPAILFLNVYECDNQWSAETAGFDVDTAAAGANLILADDSENTVNGSYVARIYKDTDEEKKLWKQDGAIYSYMSMNVDGEDAGTGVLDLNAANEGMDTELHLTINGGNLNIFADNDGINTNEDGVSVTTINGGNIHIMAGLGAEGDGIDSNGWLVINGGTVVASANPGADAGMDSDMGSFVNGGTVVALGSTMDWAESDSEQVTMNLQFAQYEASDSAIVVTDEDGTIVFAYDPSEDEVLGANARKYMGAILSCPDFALEDRYHVYIGGTLTGTEAAGIYDAASVTDYSSGVQQVYTGSDIRMRPGGFGNPSDPAGHLPFTGEAQDRPEPPEGFEPGERPEPPEGFEPGGNPFGPGNNPSVGFADSSPYTGDPMDGAGEPQELFFMQDKVNNFSGVGDK